MKKNDPYNMQTLLAQKVALAQRLPRGDNVSELLIKHTHIIDTIIQQHWITAGLEKLALALYATGSYGRKELFIHSDVDLIILHPEPLTEKDEQKLGQFITGLWDAKIPISHYIADFKQAFSDATCDLSRYTNFLELRYITGQAAPDEFIDNIIKAKKPLTFYTEKLKEQEKRHAAYGETSYLLEPNIKESPGGLRDIHVINWLIKRLSHDLSYKHICLENLLTEYEYQELQTYYQFFCLLRWVLHSVVQKPEERLLFEHQKNIAQKLTYPGATLNDKVEKLMNEYYFAIKKNNPLLDILHYQIKQKYQKPLDYTENTSPYFMLIDGYIDIVNTREINKTPRDLLGLFQFASDSELYRGFTVNTIRYFRNNLNEVSRLQHDEGFSKAFISLIKTTEDLEKALRLMHRYDLLGAYLPDFQRLTGRMQFDLFHVYTVDKHLLMVVKTLISFKSVEEKSSHPLCHQLINQLSDETVLRLAALFHDIGKGLNGDHSTLGSEIALRFAESHQLDSKQKNLLAWLVKNHLLMSITAQKKDIYSPDVIEDFAQQVGTIERLNHLYLLTVADIIATNTKLWNSWKASLLKQLYYACLKCFEDAEQRYPTSSIAAMTKQQALNLLSDSYPTETIETLWRSWPDKYFLRHSPKMIAKQTSAVLSREKDSPVILVSSLSGSKTYEIFIYMQDKPLIVCNTTDVLDRLHLSIIEAQVLTTKNHDTLDSYVVITTDGAQANLSAKEIQYSLEKTLTRPLKIPKNRKHLQSRRQKQFMINPTIHYSDDGHNARTVLSLIARDKAGLLATISKAFSLHNISIQHAKIATMGERAEDTFFITNKNTAPLTVEEQNTLAKTIMQLLGDNHG